MNTWTDKQGKTYEIETGFVDSMTTKHIWYAMRYTWRKATALAHLSPSVIAKLRVVNDVFAELEPTLTAGNAKKAPPIISGQDPLTSSGKLTPRPENGKDDHAGRDNEDQRQRNTEELSPPCERTGEGIHSEWTFNERRREDMLQEWGFYDLLNEYVARTKRIPRFYSQGKKGKQV